MPRLIASLIGLITIVSLVLMTILVEFGRARLLDSLGERATATADHLAQTLSFPIWNAVHREIDAQLEATMLDPALYGIELEMEDIDPGARAWSRGADWSPRAVAPEEEPGLLDLRRDIKYEDRIIGSLRLLFTTKFISQSVSRESLIFGALLLTEVLTLAIGLYLIMRGSVFRPLRGIERWASGVSLGGFAPLPEDDRFAGEIASLRDSIVRMVSLLRERYDAVAAAEKEMRTALEQKGILVNELFHRTRNTLQVLSSMIGLRENTVQDPIARAELRGIMDRVFSLSLAQEQLYKNADLSYVNLGAYLGTLVKHLIRERAGAEGRIRAEIEAESVHVLLDVALPLGLAATELVDNSLKHAFPGSRQGVIALSLKRLPEGSVLARLRDDGIGPPAGFDPARDARLGLETAKALITRQLHGKLDFDFAEGFACSMLFDLNGPGFAPRV